MFNERQGINTKIIASDWDMNQNQIFKEISSAIKFYQKNFFAIFLKNKYIYSIIYFYIFPP